MIFNGHTHDTLAQIDEVSMSQIMTMYADGLVGNFQILTVLGQLTAGVFNYIRPANSPDYKLAKILGVAYDYIIPPASPEMKKQAANNALKAFMMTSPGYNENLFKAQNG
jgi:hypothetical protein